MRQLRTDGFPVSSCFTSPPATVCLRWGQVLTMDFAVAKLCGGFSDPVAELFFNSYGGLVQTKPLNLDVLGKQTD